MPNRGDRGGAQTRARIAAVATELFLRQGFDEVTIADVAAAAGVSKVTVFAHFDRKEDLLLDRLPDAQAIVRGVVGNRRGDEGPTEALRRTLLTMAEQRHPLSGLSQDAEPFVRTLLSSPLLIARLRAFEYEIETQLAAELDADLLFTGDSALTAALIVAAYRTVATETARRRLSGDNLDQLATEHRRRLDKAFDAVVHGVPDH